MTASKHHLHGDSVCEEPVFNGIYRMHAEQLRNYLYYKCGELEVAEDLCQESFIQLWRKCRDVIIEKAKSYLFTVGHRLFLDRVKARKVELKFQKTQTEGVQKEDPYFQLTTEELKIKIERAISELPEGQREVFLMNRIDQLTYREIAERLGVSQTAAEKKMSKALLKLHEKIEEFRQFKI